MTVKTTNSFNTGIGNGSAETFPFTFRCQDASHVKVYVDDVEQTIGFSVVVSASGEGGSVTFDVAPAVNAAVLIRLVPPFTMFTKFEDSGPFNGSALDGANDAAALRDIYLKGETDRSLKLAPGMTAAAMPSSAELAGAYLAFDAEGNPVPASGTGSDAGLRTDLAADAGSSLVNFKQAGSGAIKRTMQHKLRDTLSPMDFGAAGDGSDDTTAVYNCLLEGFATGLPVVDPRQFGVTGNLEFDGLGTLRARLGLKQLDPNNISRRTLFFNGCAMLLLDIVGDKGAGTTSGSLNDAAFMWVTGGLGHRILLDVTGDGIGSGLVMDGAKDFKLDYFAHDMSYGDVAAGDDRLIGAWLLNCEDFEAWAKARDLDGNGTNPYNTGVNTWTRGLALGGCSRGRVHAQMKNVGQGVDVTGSDGNFDISLIGGLYYQMALYGEKFANSAVRCKSVGAKVNRVGYAGITVQGPSGAGLANKSMDVEIDAFTVIDPGWNASNFSQRSGIMVNSGGFDNDYPKGVRIGNGKITCTTGTMTHGIYANVTYDGTSKKLNEVVGKVAVIGHSVAAVTGMHRPYCRITGSSTQAIVTATQTAIDFDTEVSDTSQMHSLVSNTSIITIAIAGDYDVVGEVSFAADATGTYRRAAIFKNGSTTSTEDSRAPLTGRVTKPRVADRMTFAVGDQIALVADHDKGSNLNVDRTKTFLSVELVRQA